MLTVRIPVLVAESPGVIVAESTTVSPIVPAPNSAPPFRLSVPALAAVRLPSTVVVPPVCVKLKPDPPTVKVLPVETWKIPALVKLPPAVVRLWFRPA